MCKSLQLETQRTSGYHAQVNGLTEQSIRNVTITLRTALLDKGLSHKYWKKLLSSLIFALNTSIENKSINAVLFEVLFGRKPVLPIDIVFHAVSAGINAGSATD